MMKIGYISAIPGSIVAFVIFVILTQIFPSKGPQEDLQILLTVSTFIFAILIGFFIARLNTRYNSLRECISSEDATWVVFYKAAGIVNKRFQDIIRERIDAYYQISYDFGVGYWYKHNAAVYLSVFDDIKEHAKKMNDEHTLLDDMVTYLKEIEQLRNRAAVVAQDNLTKGHWGILIGLGAIIIYCLFSLMVPDLYSQALTSLLSTMLILVLLIMNDIQNLRIGGESFLDESGEEVFEVIGKKRYYQKKWIDNGYTTIPKDVTNYRLGVHKPGEPSDIKIIDLNVDKNSKD